MYSCIKSYLAFVLQFYSAPVSICKTITILKFICHFVEADIQNHLIVLVFTSTNAHFLNNLCLYSSLGVLLSPMF